MFCIKLSYQSCLSVVFIVPYGNESRLPQISLYHGSVFPEIHKSAPKHLQGTPCPALDAFAISLCAVSSAYL